MNRQFVIHMAWLVGIILLLATCTIPLKNDPATLNDKTLYLSAPTQFMPANQAEWNSLSFTIRTTTAKHIVIYWAGDGGRVDLGKMFINTIKGVQRQGKTVKFIFIGRVISMHASVSCHVNAYEFRPGSYLLFHSARNSNGTISPEVSRKDILDPCMQFISKEDEERIITKHQALIIHSDGSRTWQQEA